MPLKRLSIRSLGIFARAGLTSLVYFYSKAIKVCRGTALRETEVHPTSKLHSGTSAVRTKVARHSYCGYDCMLNLCDIGPFCSIASRVTIGGAAHPTHYVSTSPVFLSHKGSLRTKFSNHNYLPQLRTNIGADVWIGDGAYLKAGIKVGHGAVIGMGAVVTRDVPPYSIVAGNPARVIRSRFSEDTVRAMLELAWWDWTDERIFNHAMYVTDPTTFIERAHGE
jgi:chloramphenicol O-acetyltransferase type B